MNGILKLQILEIRDTGLTNMFDKNKVQWLANERGLFKLVFFIRDHSKEYFNFILTGEEK